MIKHWFFSGDKHGNLNNFYIIESTIKEKGYNSQECGVIILGDVGFNFYLDERDEHLKKRFTKNCNYTIYCLKGNHDARPQLIKNINKIYDYNVCGPVYQEEKYPNIKYFLDTIGQTYTIQGYRVLTIGGAYSIDKYYRIENNWEWFEDEQLSTGEMTYISNKILGNNFDFVLTHTCPYSWMPIDLFLNSIDQSKVDNSMEIWLDELKNKINYKCWLFAHFHDDRLVCPKVEMLYNDVVELEYFIDHYINKTVELPDYFNYDSNYNNKE